MWQRSCHKKTPRNKKTNQKSKKYAISVVYGKKAYILTIWPAFCGARYVSTALTCLILHASASARKPYKQGLYWNRKSFSNIFLIILATPIFLLGVYVKQQQVSFKYSISIFQSKCCYQHKTMYNQIFKGHNMKIDRPALKESIVDTLLGAVFNFPLSWLTITLVLLFTQNSFIISLSQLIVLSIIAIIRRYYTRVYFDKQNKRNGL